jgi:hypothetical protein
MSSGKPRTVYVRMRQTRAANPRPGWATLYHYSQDCRHIKGAITRTMHNIVTVPMSEPAAQAAGWRRCPYC